MTESAIRPGCTGSLDDARACCRRRPTGSTPAASCGPTRSGSASSGSTSTRRRSASSSASTGGTDRPIRAEVLDIVAARGKMQNPETGSGGMLVGTVEEVGPESPLGLAVGDRVATLVSLTLTPLVIEDGLARWDGRGEQVPCDGYAVLFGRSIAAVLPDDLPRRAEPGGHGRLRRTRADRPGRRGGTTTPVVAVIGGAGKSGSLSLAAARRAGATRTIGVVPHEAEAELLARRRARRRRSWSPTPATRSRCATPSRQREDRPTSPSCASTCPAARAARSWPPPTGAPSSSSRWPPRSPPPRSAPRAWPPTSPCWSATATCPGHAAYALELLREDAGRPRPVRTTAGGAP